MKAASILVESSSAKPAGLPQDLLLRAAETSSFGMTLADARQADLPLVYVNRAFTDMTGYGADEAIGRNCRFLQGPDTSRASVAQIRQTLHNETASTVLLLNYRKDGTRFWNRFQLSPVHDEAGELSAFLGMQVDITDDVERVGMENERQRLETLGRVAGGVAHELNNALQPIRLYADLLVEGPAPTPELLTKCGKGILDNAQFASEVVSQVLAFSRRDGGLNHDYDAKVIISEAVEFAYEYLPSSMTLEKQGFEAGGLFDGTMIRVNRTELFQIMINLFTNAAAASGDKGRITVRLGAPDDSGLNVRVDAGATERPKNYLEISVSDNGQGIENGILKHIFEPFFTTKAPGEGTGLGLSMIYGIVERWGGRIAVSSVPGKGTTFRILVPVLSNT